MLVTRHPTRSPFAGVFLALCLVSCVEVRAEKLRSLLGGVAHNGGLGYVSPTFLTQAQRDAFCSSLGRAAGCDPW